MVTLKICGHLAFQVEQKVVDETYAKDQYMLLYLLQSTLDRELLVIFHPDTHTPEMKWAEEFVPFFETGTGVLVGSGPESTSWQDDDGAATARDAVRTVRRREESMSLGLKERGRVG